MTSSSCATVLYLWKHIKTMQATPSSSFSSPHLQSQWRVTITGIIQAGLSIFSLLCTILHYFLPESVEFEIQCTVISFFSLGTMINFGFGQTLFRQRATDLWNRAVQSTQLVITVAYIFSLEDKGPKQQNGSVTSASVNDSEADKGIENVRTGVEASYFILCVIAMTSSSCATVLYLWKHMKTMQATPSSSFSSPHLQSQWRVTITGIIQAGLYTFSSLWIILDYFIPEFVDFEILGTVISFFSVGTMINFGFGQTLFRQRAADLWNRAVQSTQLCGFNRA
ncbi:uncharacterized protein LOC135241288 [Anguilla rostrata]|uniref:uncharacterized protein LOC135241288 n=1 Tax=Anguilla rostrata TaxID=7938 RepID=UPI0030CDCBE9